MKSVLVLGGYGGFGKRLSTRLARDGWHVLVAGRNGDKPEAFAATLPNARGLVADRNGDLSPVLKQCCPDLVIDAAGPFQGSGYAVAEACIAHGVHYIDLADARDFVCGIGALKDAATRAGVTVIAGGSSVPALSGAVVRRLTGGMETVRSVETSISASNRATAGASVSAAILSYLGKPVRIWRGRRWRQAPGLHLIMRERYAIAGHEPLSRLVALSDVPDHEIFPVELPGKPATTFRAGPEFGFQLIALWLLSWPVKWGWLRSAVPLARWLLPLQRLTSGLGSDRSAMAVEVKGLVRNRPGVRRWTLIADRGDGPEIPVIPAQLLANALSAGRLKPGALTSASLLSLEDFNAEFGGIAVTHAIETRSCTPLYQRILGPAFDKLPPPVRELHTVVGDGGATGTATVRRGKSFLARLVATAMRFPPEGDHDLHVSFEERHGIEHWTRDFGGHVFSSHLSQSGDHLVERFGPMRFYFDLPADASSLTMVMRRWTVFSVPLPLALAPKSTTLEWAEGKDYCFDVPIDLPAIGRIVHYRGRLRMV
ncbi:SDR family oxidoreductase [Roseibium aggregatum]|uniref:SDR family NAD(P)-dependent oxidoreductase n=1 Tax=Roseibium aggregatum TaxID=187304 RepID=A0A926S6K9_9HYPH|nr:SDR family oxidoreductase [Roseibium aggregatum]MBD1548663.1 SDR family NAD(P)-dependent oxidoreductase [Roseibium aggregatum]